MFRETMAINRASIRFNYYSSSTDHFGFKSLPRKSGKLIQTIAVCAIGFRERSRPVPRSEPKTLASGPFVKEV